MESDDFLEFEIDDTFYYLETETLISQGSYPMYYSTWTVYDDMGETILSMDGEYPEYKAKNPFYIEEMIDTLLQIVRGKIYLHKHQIPDENALEGKEFQDYLKYTE